MTAASRLRLHQLANQGLHRASVVLVLQTQMSQVIATILLANTIVLTTLTAVATNLFTGWFGETGVLYAATLLSALITIYLEVLPKIFVFNRAERTAMVLAPFVYKLKKVLHPITQLVHFIAHKSLYMAGVSMKAPQTHTSSLDELKSAIELYQPQKNAPEERLMLKNILELTRVKVVEAMVHRNHIFSLNSAMPMEQLVPKALESPFTRIPLWKNNAEKIVGILHIKELSRALQHTPIEKLKLETLHSAPWFIPSSTTLIAQLRAFRQKRTHFAFVVDEYGALAGIITLEDILEEIVGDIQDEHDISLSGVTKISKGRFLVEGHLSVRDLNRTYHWRLPEDKATTLAGLVLDLAGYIPKERQSFSVGTLSIKVIKRWRNQLKMLEVSSLSHTISLEAKETLEKQSDEQTS